MSFFATQEQLRQKKKDVTRRTGWSQLHIGERINAVEKGQGLKKGERVTSITWIQVTDIRREPLQAIQPEDLPREGFPDMTTEEFIAMFCKMNRCKPDTTITRIEFKYIRKPKQLDMFEEGLLIPR